MKFSKSQKRLFALLAVVLVYAGYDYLSNADTLKNDQFVESSPAESRLIKKGKRGFTAAKRFDSDLKWKRDPFAKVALQTGNTGNAKTTSRIPLTLSAVSLDGKKSFVIINNRILSTNDLIEGYKIRKILAEKVILEKDNRLQQLTFK